MTRMTGPDCAVMCNLINIHTYIRECEWHRMTRMTGPDCVVMCNLINTYVHTYIPTYLHTYIHVYIHIYIHTYIPIVGGVGKGRRISSDPL